MVSCARVVALRYPLLAVAVEADASSPFVNLYDLERRRIVRWVDRFQRDQFAPLKRCAHDVQGGDSIDILGMSPHLSLIMFGVLRHV